MIHTIVIPDKQTISFDIPKKYLGKEIEIIAFVRKEGIARAKQIKKKVSFSALSIDTKGYKFNRDEANTR